MRIVKPLWEATKAISDEARVDFINAKLARATADILLFRRKKEGGDAGPGQDEKAGGPGRRKRGPPSSVPGPDAKPTAIPGTEGNAIKKRPRAKGIKYRKLDEMDDNYVVDVVVDADGIEVRLNGRVEAIRLAYSKPFKIYAIWPVIAKGITAYLLSNPSELDELIPDYESLLGVNTDDATELEARLFTHFIKKQPSAEEERNFEPKARDIA